MASFPPVGGASGGLPEDAVIPLVTGLSGYSTIPPDNSGIKYFQFAEGMPHHLLMETVGESRLVHEFSTGTSFVFTPTDNERKGFGVNITSSNEAGPAELGEYTGLPVYTMEPNYLVRRDTYGFINFPRGTSIDISKGFYFFGTVSGWAGRANTDGAIYVYMGTEKDHDTNGGSIGFVIDDTLSVLTGTGSEPANSGDLFGFNLDTNVCHFYRYAIYVNEANELIYCIKDLNNGNVSTGKTVCDLSRIGADPKLWINYKRRGDTSVVAVGETHLVVNSFSDPVKRWNWRF